MASYLDWNAALTDHVTAGLPRGTRVQLSVSPELLAQVGSRCWSPQDRPWHDTFLQALREQLVRDGQLRLEGLLHRDARHRPLCVAFLGAMVMAAGPAGQVGKPYLACLADMLGLSQNRKGRLPGFRAGTELPLWALWNLYLLELNLQPTATDRPDPYRCSTLPLSQLPVLSIQDYQRVAHPETQ